MVTLWLNADGHLWLLKFWTSLSFSLHMTYYYYYLLFTSSQTFICSHLLLFCSCWRWITEQGYRVQAQGPKVLVAPLNVTQRDSKWLKRHLKWPIDFTQFTPRINKSIKKCFWFWLGLQETKRLQRGTKTQNDYNVTTKRHKATTKRHKITTKRHNFTRILRATTKRLEMTTKRCKRTNKRCKTAAKRHTKRLTTTMKNKRQPQKYKKQLQRDKTTRDGRW